MTERPSQPSGNITSAGVKFHEQVADGWSAGYRRGSFKRRLDCLATIVERNASQGQHWLDLGCGSGVLTMKLLHQGASVTALDGSPGMLGHAKREVGETVPGRVSWILGNAQNFPEVSDAAFDGVLCSSVIEYMEDPRALLSEAWRVLRPGGVLVLSIPSKYSAVRMLQKAIRWVTRSVGTDSFSYLSVSRFEVSQNLLRDLFDQTGFGLSRVTEFDPYFPRFAYGVIRPALLVCEAIKLPGQTNLSSERMEGQ